MNYSDIITRAFHTLKKGSLWGFVVSTYGATLLLFVVAAVLGVVGAGVSISDIFRHASTSSAFWDSARPALALAGALVLAGLLAIPLGLIAYGGLIHQTDEAQAGRDASVGDAWRFGARRMGRVFLVELILGVLGFALTLAVVVPIVLVLVGSSRSNNAGAGLVAGICGGALLILLLVFALWMVGAIESLAIRYALIGDRTASDAIGAGWKAFKARFGNVFVLLLILFGFRIVVFFVQSIFNYALEFVAFGTAGLTRSVGSSALESGQALLRVAPIFLLIYLVAFIIAMAWQVFAASLWTAFFRQLTGLDQPPAPAYGAYPQPAPAGMPQPPSGFAAPFPPPTAPQPTVGVPMPPEPPVIAAPFGPARTEPPMAPQPPDASQSPTQPLDAPRPPE